MNARSRSRSIILALVVVVAVAGLGVAGAFAAGGAPSLDLPTVSAQDLVASTIHAAESGRPISGSVATHVDLGLPDIPSSMSGGPSGVESVIGDQRFKVWSSPDGLRVSQLLPFAERVFVGSPTDVWTWNSDQDLAVHTSVDASTRRAVSQNLTSTLGDPAQLASELLQATSGVADVSVSAPQDVAGRATYTLRLTPTSSPGSSPGFAATKIGRDDVSIDAETRLPLRVQVFPRGSASPAIEAGFSSVDFGPIDPSMFTFTPPPGATVKQAALAPQSDAGTSGGGTSGGAGEHPSGADQPRLLGNGFGTVVAVPVSNPPQELDSILPFEGPLGSAELVHAGGTTWLLAGAVGLQDLNAASTKLA
jgi:outer membrane lipoprotein-sorting protein